MAVSKIRVGIIGATGYTAAEAAKILVRHPNADLVLATSRSDASRRLDEVHRFLLGRTDVVIETLDVDRAASRCDVVMSCLPHGASSETVRHLCESGVRVIDFSADFRLSSRQLYDDAYGTPHAWPERIGSVPYGLAELSTVDLSSCDLVANPGSYPTSAIVPLVPIVKSKLIESDVIIDSKSGVSGAGRSPKLATLYCETDENFSAYAVGTHRHAPEIIDLVQRYSGHRIDAVFTPHLVPMQRGILSTIYTRPTPGNDAASIRDCLRERYADEPFIRVVDSPPAVGEVTRTNELRMSVAASAGRVIIVSVIDNLVKGASGAAVQNMNLMFGLDATTALV